MSRYHFIAAVRLWPNKGGNQHAILTDALDHFHHGFVLSDLEGVILKVADFFQRDLDDPFQPLLVTLRLRGKEVID